MKTSPHGLELIRGFEGLWLVAYDDATERVAKEPVKGTLTIGYGHTSAAGPPKVTIGMILQDKDHAEAILVADLVPVEAQVMRLVRVPLNQNQFDALVSFQFNTGWLEHKHCSLLSALNSGNYNLADTDFMLYDRAQGKILVGLNYRRRMEKELFEKPA